MKRVFDNLYVDLIGAALMVVMVATGYILHFPLPAGTNKSLSLWGLTRHEWGKIHFWVSLGLLVLIVVHVCLHWQWIVISVKRRLGRAASPSGSPMASGVLTVLVLTGVLVLFGWAAHFSVKPIAAPTEEASFPSNDRNQQVGATSTAKSTPVQNEVAFWRDVYPIFEKSCLSCHGPEKQIGGFRVDRKDDFFSDASRPALVEPGVSQGSPLIFILSGTRKGMARADAHRLAANEVAIVKAWIDAGAVWPDRPDD